MFVSYRSMLKREFEGYSLPQLTKDLAAGITVAAVALPLALAFGVGCGADAAAGLITAIVGGLVISMLSGARFQISGPTGAMTAVLTVVVARYGVQGVFIVSFMAGIILFLLGFFRLGKLTALIPSPVIAGFTSGIAVIIALGQIDSFFGTTSSGTSTIERLFSYSTHGFNINPCSALIGITVMAIMVIWPKKLSEKVPSSLVAIIIATAISEYFHLDTATVGNIPQTLLPKARLSLSALNLSTLFTLLSPAFTVAMLGMIESLLCGASASQMEDGAYFNPNQELIAQGIGNMMIPFFGGVPATAAIARTSVAIKSGCVTRITGVFHALGLLASMFLLSPVMSKLPLSALAGVLMITAWRMNDFTSIKRLFREGFRSAIASFLVTMICTVVFDLTIAIVIGIEMAIIFFVAKAVEIDVDISPVSNTRLENSDVDVESMHKNTVVVYITGIIFFSNTAQLKEKLSHLGHYSKIIFSLRGVPMIDVAGAQTILEVVTMLRSKDCEVVFCGAHHKVRETLTRCNTKNIISKDDFYWSVDRVLLD